MGMAKHKKKKRKKYEGIVAMNAGRSKMVVLRYENSEAEARFRAVASRRRN